MITIYTDGSCSKNGSKDAEGGFGVVVCKDGKIIDAYYEHAVGTTNNRMEIEAILWALRKYGAKEENFFVPIVYSDSQYCVRSFTEWLPGWKRNGWTRAKGKALENKDLIQEYDRLVNEEGLRIDLRHIKGHAGNEMNNIADALATGRITPMEIM